MVSYCHIDNSVSSPLTALQANSIYPPRYPYYAKILSELVLANHDRPERSFLEYHEEQTRKLALKSRV